MTYSEAKQKVLEIELSDEAINLLLLVLKDFKHEFETTEQCIVCCGSGEGSHDGSGCQICKGCGEIDLTVDGKNFGE